MGIRVSAINNTFYGQLKSSGTEMKAIQMMALMFATILLGCKTNPVKPGFNDMSEAVRGLNMVPLIPPDNEYQRGSVIAVRKKDPFDGDLLCSANSLFDKISMPAESNTVSQEWSRKVSSDINLGAEAVNKVNAALKANLVKKITTSLSQVKLYNLPEEKVYEAAASNLGSQFCIKAIRSRLAEAQKEKVPVYLITRTLMADADYNIEWNDGVSIDAQAQFAPTVKGILKAATSESGSGSLTGTGLIFGVRGSEKLLLQYLENLPKDAQNVTSINAAVKAVSKQIQIESALNLPDTPEHSSPILH